MDNPIGNLIVSIVLFVVIGALVYGFFKLFGAADD